jgi:hypothetical protein
VNLFFSILAWTFLVLSILRIVLIFWTAKHHADVIRVAEMLGENPVGRALVKPAIAIIVCLAWIISSYLS